MLYAGAAIVAIVLIIYLRSSSSSTSTSDLIDPNAIDPNTGLSYGDEISAAEADTGTTGTSSGSGSDTTDTGSSGDTSGDTSGNGDTGDSGTTATTPNPDNTAQQPPVINITEPNITEPNITINIPATSSGEQTKTPPAVTTPTKISIPQTVTGTITSPPADVVAALTPHTSTPAEKGATTATSAAKVAAPAVKAPPQTVQELTPAEATHPASDTTKAPLPVSGYSAKSTASQLH